MNLRTHLLAARARQKHRQQDAADTIGVSRKTLSVWECGDAFPGFETVSAVADYLRLTELEVEDMRPPANRTSTPKRRARAAVHVAVRKGDLRRPSACEVCDADDSADLQYHHWSYDVAHHLDVIPLCRACHLKVHRGAIPEPRTGRTLSTK